MGIINHIRSGPGFSSMSPDSIIVKINTFLYLLVCVGRHSGRLPVQCILMFIKLWIRCWWSHNFVLRSGYLGMCLRYMVHIRDQP
jgi:hypothetical protein